MTRSNAREIVAHLIFEMNFTTDSVDQVVDAAENQHHSHGDQHTLQLLCLPPFFPLRFTSLSVSTSILPWGS